MKQVRLKTILNIQNEDPRQRYSFANNTRSPCSFNPRPMLKKSRPKLSKQISVNHLTKDINDTMLRSHQIGFCQYLQRNTSKVLPSIEMRIEREPFLPIMKRDSMVVNTPQTSRVPEKYRIRTKVSKNKISTEPTNLVDKISLGRWKNNETNDSIMVS